MRILPTRTLVGSEDPVRERRGSVAGPQLRRAFENNAGGTIPERVRGAISLEDWLRFKHLLLFPSAMFFSAQHQLSHHRQLLRLASSDLTTHREHSVICPAEPVIGPWLHLGLTGPCFRPNLPVAKVCQVEARRAPGRRGRASHVAWLCRRKNPCQRPHPDTPVNLPWTKLRPPKTLGPSWHRSNSQCGRATTWRLRIQRPPGHEIMTLL